MKEYLNKDLYEILGTDYDADVVSIKAAYRKKARVYHPDVNNNTQESIQKFKDITEAYEFLIDVQKRKQYDEIKGFTRKRAQDSQTARTGAKKAYSYVNETTAKTGAKSTQTAEKTVKTEKAEKNEKGEKGEKGETKESFSHVFNNILEGLFPEDGTKEKKTAKSVCHPQNGRDINLSVTIKIPEALNGAHRVINVLHTQRCPKCEGRKFINGAKCPMCKGTGEVSIHKKLSVKIPANVKKGAKIRIANEGNKGCNGGTNGDLYLHIDIEENSFFKYDGLNVSCEIPITPYEAALGANIEVPSLAGTVSMKVPPGTTSGQKFRLAGEGVSDEKKRGDQIVTVKIEMPKDISKEEKELYEKLKNLSHKDIRENLKNE